jgi:hypothetical protein
MEDMVTDLLSNPVDVENWVPDWVDEEARRRKAAGIAGDQTGDSLKAHIGIVSSASAILKDMEDRGLLRVSAGQPLSRESLVRLPEKAGSISG